VTDDAGECLLRHGFQLVCHVGGRAALYLGTWAVNDKMERWSFLYIQHLLTNDLLKPFSRCGSNSRVPGLQYGIVSVILCLAILSRTPTCDVQMVR